MAKTIINMLNIPKDNETLVNTLISKISKNGSYPGE